MCVRRLLPTRGAWCVRSEGQSCTTVPRESRSDLWIYPTVILLALVLPRSLPGQSHCVLQDLSTTNPAHLSTCLSIDTLAVTRRFTISKLALRIQIAAPTELRPDVS
jgi:hypothetical protein